MNKCRKLKTLTSILKLLLLIGIVVFIPVYIYFYHREVITSFDSLDDVTSFLMHYKNASIPVYIVFQTLQIVISVIPGQAFQLAAGYLYRFLPGLLFSVIGAVLGTSISFYLAKFLGRDAVHILFGEEKTAYYLERLNSKRAYTLVFVLYLIPGLPKDVISYIAGVSEMKFKAFLVFSLIGRLPGMSASLLIGELYFHNHYVAMGVVAVLVVIAFIACVVKRDSIKTRMDRLYDRVSK